MKQGISPTVAVVIIIVVVLIIGTIGYFTVLKSGEADESSAGGEVNEGTEVGDVAMDPDDTTESTPSGSLPGE